jgi:hypothetical protein
VTSSLFREEDILACIRSDVPVLFPDLVLGRE